MKAAVIYEHGGTDCVRVEKVAEPKHGRGEIILKVKSAGLINLKRQEINDEKALANCSWICGL